MTPPSPGLGGWAPDMSFAGPEWAAATPAQQAAAQQVAVATLWALTGRVFGLANVLCAPWVPYAAPYYYRSYGYPWVQPYLISKWDRAKRLLLPGPVASITQVEYRQGDPQSEGRTVLTPEVDYHLDVDGHLVKTNGIWAAQNMHAPFFTVTYVRGVAVPAAANVAAGIYAFEWLKGHTGNPQSRLPSRTREAARAGVSVSMIAPEALAAAGLTGIPEVDVFIRTVNPGRMTVPPVLWSPEVGTHRIISETPVENAPPSAADIPFPTNTL